MRPSFASRCVRVWRQAAIVSFYGIAVAACDRWPESDQLVSDHFNQRLGRELRKAVSDKKPVRLERVATFQWDTAYFYSSQLATPETGSAGVARKAAESTGTLARKDLDVVIVFMDKGRPVRTVTRFYGNSGVSFRVPSGAAVAKDAAVFDLQVGQSIPELRIRAI